MQSVYERAGNTLETIEIAKISSVEHQQPSDKEKGWRNRTT
jgi:hypothetical protein